MAFTISQQQEQPGPEMFYDPMFRHMVEMHLNQLRLSYAVKKELKAEELVQFEGDFSGFLLSKGHGLEVHWLLMRVNGMTNPLQFGKELRDPYQRTQRDYYLEPHPEAVAQLQQYWITLQQR